MVITKKTADKIEVQFSFAYGEDGFKQALENVKSLPGRKWDSASKRWTVPNIPTVIEKMKSWDWQIDPLLEKITHKKVSIDLPEGLELYPFQKTGVEFLESRNGRALIADEMGCIDGEAIVSINRGGASRQYTLAAAYHRFHNTWDKNISSKIRCLKDNATIGIHPIKNILDKGKALVFELKTESEKTINTTSDHPFLTLHGWVPLSNLKIGDTILTNGKLVCPECGNSENIITYKYSKFLGLCKSCMYSKHRKNKNWVASKKHKGNDGYIYLRGYVYKNNPRYSSSGLLEHVYIIENYLKRKLTKDEQIHHINGKRDDNRLENLQVLTISEHNKIHKGHKHFGNYAHKNGNQIVTTPIPDIIISIKKIGVKHVYDIVMEDPFHNFIANKFIVHNCGKTVQALSYCLIHPELKPIIICCPASLKLNWKNECIKWGLKEIPYIISGRSDDNYQNEKIIIINYDILKDHLSSLISLKPKIVISDECFPSTTTLHTDKGLLTIGNIVNNKIKCLVLSYNLNEKILEYMPIIRYIKNKQTFNLIRIKHSKGEFVCTLNHKIWSVTDGKYKKAEEIKNNEELCLLQQFISSKIFKNTKILFYKLLCKMENESTRNKRKSIYRKNKKKNNKIKTKMDENRSFFRIHKKTLSQNEKKQSLQKSRNNKKRISNKRKKWNFACMERRKRREWKTNSSTNIITQTTWKTMGIRIYSYYRKIKRKIQSSYSLQNRFSLSKKENSYRNRWKNPFTSDNQRKRHEKRGSLTRVRVESVEILESPNRSKSPGCSKNDYVYNLEIKKNHNYFADNILVSNCHLLKNKKALRTKAFQKLAKHCKKIIALTGTPIINKPVEFYNILNILRPDIFNNFWTYAMRYCAGKSNGFGMDFSGASNEEELHQILKDTVMIRRLKSEVLPDLPIKRKVIIPLEIDNKKEYQKTIDEFDDSENVLASIEALKQVAVKGKMKQAITWIENFLESDEKLVVFATHHFVIDAIMEKFPDISVKLDGRDNQENRQFSVDEFQNNSDIKLFVGNIKAAGVGITLTAASNTCFLELGWTPGEMDQAEDRCVLEGQLIMTAKKGYIPIEKLNVGDSIINMNNEIDTITNISKKTSNRKPVTEIEIFGWYEKIKTTSDHKFYVNNKKWKEAKDISINDKLTLPSIIQGKEKRSIPFDQDCKTPDTFINNWGKIQKNGNKKQTPDNIILNNSCLFTFGYYIGDGFCRTNSNKSGSFVSLAGNTNKKILAMNLCEKWFADSGFIPNKQTVNNGTEYRYYSKEWANFFTKHFGKICEEKHIPEWIFGLSISQRRYFLHGLICSDGYTRKNQHEYSTTSLFLVSDYCRLLTSLGEFPSVRKILPKNDKHKPYYIIMYSTTFNRIGKIKSIKHRNGKKETVYDLTIKNNPSFLVGNFTIHNCHRIGQEDSVTSYYLIADETIESDIIELLDKKKIVLDSVIDGKKTKDESLLKEILNKIKRSK